MAFQLPTIFYSLMGVVTLKGDEDEGSPPRGGANPAEVLREKIE
jgi:hypothetical protein